IPGLISVRIIQRESFTQFHLVTANYSSRFLPELKFWLFAYAPDLRIRTLIGRTTKAPNTETPAGGLGHLGMALGHPMGRPMGWLGTTYGKDKILNVCRPWDGE